MALVQCSASSCVLSDERKELSEVLDHQENCSTDIDPLNNSYMTNVMIIAELLLLRGGNRPDWPATVAMKSEGNSRATQAETFRSRRDYFWFFWTTHALDDYDLAGAKTQLGPVWATHEYWLQWVTLQWKQEILEATEEFWKQSKIHRDDHQGHTHITHTSHT